MTRRNATRVIGFVVGLAVLATGVTYTFLRPERWSSHSSVVLVARETKDGATVADSFDRAGVAGTFVEVLASRDTLADAGSPPVAVAVRAVPDSRVITVTTTGAKPVVRDANAALLRTGRAAAPSIDEAWAVRILEHPSAPEQAGPATPAFLLAALLLAILAGAGSAAVAARLLTAPRPEPLAARPRRREPGDGDEDDLDGAPSTATVPAGIHEALGIRR